MKRTVLFLSLLVFSVGLFAQVQASASDSIIFDKTVHNFGTLAYGSKAECVFTYTNKGTKPLILQQVHPVCGCTEAFWSQDTIQVGGKGLIRVTYNTQLVGKFSKAITVFSNAVNSLVILVVEGEILKKEE